MAFLADLHVHSRFSRATARNLDVEALYIAAQLKGVTLVATGDFTHPQWFDELRGKLRPAEDGLWRLDAGLARGCDERVPAACRRPVRFILQTEISSIYKKDAQTRKNHNLVYFPDFDTAARFNARLARIGNVTSDGRPILGLDARDLLEIVLETSDSGFLIPAHIWTPWFSVLGSKSGFDRIEECFGDLSQYIFALETGLSSDPGMNWRVSQLDRYRLVSNSDAHSPANLAREANRLTCELGYAPLRRALAGGSACGFVGTVEFYPQEGKYHLDGHRKCAVCLEPRQTTALGERCPVCGRPLTLGVMHRVEQLADRTVGRRPAGAPGYRCLVPLADILAEIHRVGAKSKTVQRSYRHLLETLGSEYTILAELPPEEIRSSGIPLLDEALRRMRCGEIRLFPGYDGQYGRIRIFEAHEAGALTGQKGLFAEPSPPPRGPAPAPTTVERADLPAGPPAGATPVPVEDPVRAVHLTAEQRAAVDHGDGPLVIKAGPGTGKTRTLTERIGRLLTNRRVVPDGVLALTFTNQAAEEMRQRLAAMTDLAPERLPLVTTFHALGLRLLTEIEPARAGLVDAADQQRLVADALAACTGQDTTRPPGLTVRRAAEGIAEAKQTGRFADGGCGASFSRRLYKRYQALLDALGAWDFDDLICRPVYWMERRTDLRDRLQGRFSHIFVDEYQDLNVAQYRLVTLLAARCRTLAVIGDPDQAIYGFRGASASFFNRFEIDFAPATALCLTRNYRSSETILKAGRRIVEPLHPSGDRPRLWSGIEGHPSVDVIETASERAEAVAIGKIIESMLGGMGMHAMDFGHVDSHDAGGERSLADFAVLYRTRAQADVLAAVFDKAGIPWQEAGRRRTVDRPAVRRMVSLLRVLDGNGTVLDLERVATGTRTGIGARTMERLKQLAYDTPMSLEALFDRIHRLPLAGVTTAVQRKVDAFVVHLRQLAERMAGLTVVDRLTYLLEHGGLAVDGEDPAERPVWDNLRCWALAADRDTAAFTARVALQSDADNLDPGVQKVSLMTMHCAKGLEFPVVFVAGCEGELIPLSVSGDPGGPPSDPDEERRLFYVALTRARDRLFLTWARRRRIHGKTRVRRRSPFVGAIDAALLRCSGPAAAPRTAHGQVQMGLFG